jgi:hypothetical protein
MRRTNLQNSTAEITSAYEQLKVAYSDRKAKEQEKYNNEIATIRNKLVHDIKSCKELTGEIKINVRDFGKMAVQQIISELNEQGILARPEEEIDDDGPMLYKDIVNIIITTKSLDDLIEQREPSSISKNQNGFFYGQSNASNQDIAHISQMRNNVYNL